MKKFKKLLAGVMTLAMLVTMLPATVMAEDGAVEVSTYEELVAELAKDSANIVMKNDITATATQDSGYGKAGIVLEAGDVLDGNGHKLTIYGANGTWDCAVAMKGGTVKNLTIAGAFRGAFMPGANGDVVIDTCVFKDVIYTFNSDDGSKKYSVTIKNTVLNGWTSFSDVHKSVTFEGCTFGEGSGYAFCRPYQATTFTNCEFKAGFEFDTTQADDYTLEFNNCKYDSQTFAGSTIDSLESMFYNGGKIKIDNKEVNLKAVAEVEGKYYESLQEAINAAENGDTIKLLADCAESVTVTQAPDVKITIDGAGKKISGAITVDGKSERYETAGVTIKNMNFDATDIETDACINLGVDGNTNTRYTNNVTVKDCTFKGENQKKVAIKSYTGGDWNLTISDCEVDNTMHSLLQVDNVEKGLVIDGCTVNSKNGINLNSSAGVVIKDSDISVNGYAVRIGAGTGGSSGEIVLENNTLTTDNSENDAVIILRGAAVEMAELIMTDNAVSGKTNFSGATKDTDIFISSGHFTTDPSGTSGVYLPTGKAIITSTKAGYKYMVGVKQVDVDTAVSAGAPKVTVPDGIEGIDESAVVGAIASTETAEDLSAIAGAIANDATVINAVVDTAVTELGTPDVTIVVEPYLDVEVKSVETTAEGAVEMTVEITPKYNLIAEADGETPVLVLANQKMEVEKGEVVTITVPVPTTFGATAGETLWVRHVKEGINKVYKYKATVDAAGNATFDNPNGFSTFILTSVAPVAVNTSTGVGYDSLAEAVAEVENNQTIELQKDCFDNVTVSRDVTFTLTFAYGASFDGSITPGANTTLTEDGNKYTFDYTAPTSQGNKPKKYSVIIKSAENGNVKADDDRANYSQKITITVTPDKGYKLDEMTITDAKDNKVDYEKGKKENTFVFDMPKADVTIKASFEKESSKVEDEADKEEVKEEVVVEETTLVLTIGQVIYQMDGNYEVNDVAPIIKADRTFLPIRLVAETLGATVTWNEAEQSVTIVEGDTTIVIYIGQAFALVNGTPVQLDAPAFIANSRTYLPVRFVAESLGATVSWNAETNEVTIVG